MVMENTTGNLEQHLIDEKAVEYMEKADALYQKIARDKTFSWREHDINDLAITHVLFGNIDRAESILLEHNVIHYSFALAAVDKGLYRKAEEIVERIHTEDPSSSSSWWRSRTYRDMAILAAERGDYGQAEKWVKEVDSYYQERVQWRILERMVKREDVEAVGSFLKKNPLPEHKLADLFSNAVRNSLEKKNIQLAEQWTDKLFNLRREDGKHFVADLWSLPEKAFYLGNEDLAKKWVEKVRSKLTKEESQGYDRTPYLTAAAAVRAAERKDYDLAQKLAAEVGYGYVFVPIAEVAIRQGDYELAEKLVSLDHSFSDISSRNSMYCNLIQVVAKEGDFEQGLKWLDYMAFQCTRNIVPAIESALDSLVEEMARQRKYNLITELCKKEIIHRNYSPVSEVKAKLAIKTALIAAENGDYEEANKWDDQAYEFLDPKNRNSYISHKIARIAARNGHVEPAKCFNNKFYFNKSSPLDYDEFHRIDLAAEYLKVGLFTESERALESIDNDLGKMLGYCWLTRILIGLPKEDDSYIYNI